jgi:toxin ParE1/3/4
LAEPQYSPLADSDLFENAEFIARDKPAAAERWIDSVQTTCEMLADNPNVGEVRQTRSLGPCRSFVLGSHLIFFRPFRDAVEIVRIIRADRDITQV